MVRRGQTGARWSRGKRLWFAGPCTGRGEWSRFFKFQGHLWGAAGKTWTGTAEPYALRVQMRAWKHPPPLPKKPAFSPGKESRAGFLEKTGSEAHFPPPRSREVCVSSRPGNPGCPAPHSLALSFPGPTPVDQGPGCQLSRLSAIPHPHRGL